MLHGVSVSGKNEVEEVGSCVSISFGIGGIAGDLLKEVLDRPRPFIEYAGQITAITHPKTPAFP